MLPPTVPSKSVSPAPYLVTETVAAMVAVAESFPGKIKA